MATRRAPIVPAEPFDSRCPIATTLGVMGKKWAILVLRDVTFFPGVRFSEILRNNPGLTPRILSMRLKDLQDAGLLVREEGANSREVRYFLTRQGEDARPVLAALVAYGCKHHAPEVFANGKPRTMTHLFPGYQKELLGPLHAYAKAEHRGQKPQPATGGRIYRDPSRGV